MDEYEKKAEALFGGDAEACREGDAFQRMKAFVEFWMGGMSIQKIAETLDMTREDVSRMAHTLRRRGVALPKRTRSGEITNTDMGALQEIVRLELVRRGEVDKRHPPSA